MFNGKIHYKLSFSIAMLNYQRVCFVGSRVPWSSHIGGSPWFTAKELLSSDRVIRRPAILEEEEAQAIKAAGKLRDEVSNVIDVSRQF